LVFFKLIADQGKNFLDKTVKNVFILATFNLKTQEVMYEEDISTEFDKEKKVFRIQGKDYDELRNTKTTTKPLADDVAEIIGQFLIDKGYVEGKLVD